MKKTFLITLTLCASILFSGCIGGSEAETPTPSNMNSYSTDAFSINYPKGWIKIDKQDFKSNVPAEAQVIFESNIKGEFTTNVNVGKTTISEGTSSTDFAKQIIQEQKQGLLNYKEIRRETITLPIAGAATETLLIYFEGKHKPEAQERRFIQTHAVKGTSAYSVTAGMRLTESENVVQATEDMLKSFKLK